MMIKNRLRQALQEASTSLGYEWTPSKSDEATAVSSPYEVLTAPQHVDADYSSALALKLSSTINKDASTIAKEIIAALSAGLNDYATATMSAPGFINFTITPDGYCQSLQQILQQTQSWSIDEPLEALHDSAKLIAQRLQAILQAASEPLLDIETLSVQPALIKHPDCSDSLTKLLKQPQSITRLFQSDADRDRYCKALIKELSATYGSLTEPLGPAQQSSEANRVSRSKQLALAINNWLSSTAVNCHEVDLTETKLALLATSLKVLLKARPISSRTMSQK